MTDRHAARIGALLALSSLVLAFGACQLVAGVQSRSLDPVPSGCSLPGGSGPEVRVADFVPDDSAVDVCIRPSGASWGEPLILSGGTGCSQYFPASAPGFTYGQVSVPFTAPAATVDVKMITAGLTCSAPALASIDGLALASHAVTTLVRIGDDGVGQKLVALPEFDTTLPSDGGLYRVVHAMPGVGPLDFGDASQTHLPSPLTALFTQAPISYGHAATKGTPGLGGAVEDNGYVVVPTEQFNLALGLHGTGNALVLVPSLQVGTGASSFYASGITGSDAYPPQGFLCAETQSPTSPTNPLLVQCQASALPTISVDTFNASLYGPDSPDYQQRLDALAAPSELTQSTADVMCLCEVDAPTEQQAIIATAATTGFKYSYNISTTLTTPFTNPKTQAGTVPAPPTTPACAGDVPSSAVTNAISCMEQYCSNKGPGDGTGQLVTTTDCLTSNCSGPLGELLIAYPACFDCMIDYVSGSATYGSTQSLCTTNPAPSLSFEGANPTLILSRYPLAKMDSYILTSTFERMSILYAQVQLEDGLDVDFYCGMFTSTLTASSLPYDGFYGGDASTSQGQYDNEQTWQAVQLVNWVRQKSASRPAIITGDWHSGVGSASGGTNDAGIPLATPLNPQTYDTMASAQGWIPANTPAWNQAPLCNICPCSQNPLQCPGNSSSFVLQPFLYNWPQKAAAVVDEQLAYTDTPLMLAGGGQVPLSQYFGLNIHVLRPNMGQ